MRVVVTWNVGRISLLLAGGVAHAIQGFPGEPVLPGNGQAARPARGFSYWNEQVPDIPWSVHVVAIDRGHPGVALHTTYGDGRRFGMALLSEQVKALPSALGLPVAAVNGDFYGESRRYEGRPRDLQIRAGELVTGPKGHTCFWIDPDGNPHMTNLQSRLRVVWPDQTETPLGLNEERAADAAVLFTTAVGDSTRTRGRELRLERGDDGCWLPLRAGHTYLARVNAVREGGTVLCSQKAWCSRSARGSHRGCLSSNRARSCVSSRRPRRTSRACRPPSGAGPRWSAAAWR